MGHFIIGKLLHLKVKEIKLFMFGGVTTLDEDLNLNIYKEILLLIMGPITQILFVALLFILYRLEFISTLAYTKFYSINMLLLKFNLLPILPLDGGKLINNLLDLIVSYDLSHTISIIISFISLPLLFTFDNKLLIIILFTFLLLNLLNEISIHKYRLELLLLERKYKKFNFKKTIKINNTKNIMRNKNYVIIK